jgi:hypothetical protein
MARVRRCWFPEVCRSDFVVRIEFSVGKGWGLVCGCVWGTNRGGAAAVAMREIGITCCEGVLLGPRRMGVVHTQIECRPSGGSVVLWYWWGCSRVFDVADLSGKELVRLMDIDTVDLLVLFCPGWSKTSCSGDSG